MVAEICGDHIAVGQVSSCSRRTDNDTQTANGKEEEEEEEEEEKKKKKTKKKKRSFIAELDGAYCAVSTESLYKRFYISSLKGSCSTEPETTGNKSSYSDDAEGTGDATK
jgi:hypothetical protein